MKRLIMRLTLVLAWALVMAPVSASATPFTDRALWEAAVGSYANVTMPGGNYSAWASVALPSGGGDFFNLDNTLTNVGGFYYTPVADFHANGAFYPGGSSGPITAFGFDVQPYDLGGTLTINIYTAKTGVTSISFALTDTSPKFFGWSGDDVVTFSTWSTARYGLGDFVEGVAAVPDPASTLFLFGMSLAGLAAWRRRRT